MYPGSDHGGISYDPLGKNPETDNLQIGGAAATNGHVNRLIQTINGHRLIERTVLKAMNANDLSKPVKIALRTRVKQSQETRELLW